MRLIQHLNRQIQLEGHSFDAVQLLSTPYTVEQCQKKKLQFHNVQNSILQHSLLQVAFRVTVEV